MSRITDEDVLRYIELYHRRKGYPPTIREIARGLGLISTSGAFYHVEKLVEQGLITREPGIARTIRVVAA